MMKPVPANPLLTKGVNGYLKVKEDNWRVQATYHQKSRS